MTSFSFSWAGSQILQRSIPSVTVTTASVIGDATWGAHFEIAENAVVTNPQTGSTIQWNNNAVQYRNLRMEFAAGAQTRFVSNTYNGRVSEINGSNLSIGGSLMALIFSAAPSGVTNLIQLLNNAFNHRQSTVIPLGGQGVGISTPNAVVSGHQLNLHTLFACSTNSSFRHYFRFHAVAQPTNPNTPFTQTSGLFRITFDVHTGNEFSGGSRLFATRTQNINFNYSVGR
jgi:hypothetical protein